VLLGTVWQTCEETWEFFALTPSPVQPCPQDKKRKAPSIHDTTSHWLKSAATNFLPEFSPS
jgi:hypothetical protein